MENQKTKLVLEIVALAIEITETTDADIFVEYLGHVDAINVRIFNNGWESGIDEDYVLRCFSLDTKFFEVKKVLKTLRGIKTTLTDLQAQKRKEQEDAANL